MKNSDVVLLLMASKTIGFNNREVQGLLNETLAVLVTNDQIDSIYRAHEHKYIDYRKSLKSGRKSIPRRIIRYAKKHSIRINLSDDKSLQYQDVSIVSFAMSIVMSRSRIKKADVSALVQSEFPEKPFKEINPIVERLNIEGYQVKSDEFVKKEVESDLLEFSCFIEGYGQVSIRKGTKTYFDRKTNRLVVKEGRLVEFLVLLLDRQNQLYSDDIQLAINKIDSLL